MITRSLKSHLTGNRPGVSRAQYLLVGLLIFALIQLANAQLTSMGVLDSSVWLVSGIALGLCFFYGKDAVPVIFLGALAITLLVHSEPSSTSDFVFSLFHAFCLTLQSITIYLGFKQLTRNHDPFASSNLFIVFSVLCLLIGSSSALLINMNYSVFISNAPLQYAPILTTSLVNVTGLLTLSPLFIAWRFHPADTTSSNHSIEWFAGFASILVLSYLALAMKQSVLVFTVPLLMWSAARFSQLGCSFAIVAATLLVLPELSFNSADDTLIVAGWPLHQLLYMVWLALVVTTLYFSTLLSDRKKVAAQLDDIVLQRTQDLSASNQELTDEVYVRQQAEKSLRTSTRRYRALIETAGIPIIVLDQKFGIKQWNTAAEALTGYNRDEVSGKNFIDLFIPSEGQDEIAWKFTKVMESGIGKESMESEITSYDSLTHTMLWNMNCLLDNEDEQNSGQLLLIGQDISEIRKTQNQLHHLAHFDVLTNTANRRLFEDRCEQAIQSALRYRHQVALIGLDIDHFKRINDSLGHDAGDQFLVTMANRLRDCVRKEDTIARLGGDEFAVLLANVSGQSGAEIVARHILESIVQPVIIKGSELVITSSIGISLCPTDGTHYPDLLKNADMAMYRAKKAGRNNIQFYSPEMNDEMLRQLRIEQELRAAFQQNQFVLYYQPIVDIETGEVVALEALLRWQHPKKGLILPDYFLQVAEQTGQLQLIGEWALKNVCLQGRAIHEWSRSPLQIALNLSSRQYNHPGLVQLVETTTRECQFNPRNLILEMSENTITSNLENSYATLQKLSALGVSLTIDSFGTGLSSLRQLKRIPIDIIKIDRTFVNGIPEDENDMAITETLLTVANQMNLKTFATGVETKGQEAFLKINGCRYAQGYLYAAPQPVEKLPKLFESIRAGQSLSEGEQAFLPF